MVNWTLFLIVKYLLSSSSVMSLYIQSRFHSKENLNGRNYQNTRNMFNFMTQGPNSKIAFFMENWEFYQMELNLNCCIYTVKFKI